MPNYKTLFLDRDGVINTRIPNAYVQNTGQFIFKEGSLEAISKLSKIFSRIFVVTNQQGIGKGLMTEVDLSKVHDFMLQRIESHQGVIDGIYHCPNLSIEQHIDRKPNPGMALRAKAEFPEIKFSESIMVGDSTSDMLFGKRLGMKTILIRSNPSQVKLASITTVDQQFDSLLEFTQSLKDQDT